MAVSHCRSGQYFAPSNRLAKVLAWAMSSPAALAWVRISVSRSSGSNGLPFSIPSCLSMAR